ncbi:MAG TPA: F0F1 ATP synthase subunit A [Verrucomicrobiae bacterium]|nr:F0F1 ATP synthase subunit A [Verrucomicrobiae bacterium]
MWVAVIVNRLFGGVALAVLSYLHIDPVNLRYPIPTHVCMEIFVFVIAAAFFLWLRGRISAEKPGATQQVMEMLLHNPMGVGVSDLLEESIGHGSEKYLPMIGAVGIWVLFCNLVSVFPTLESPTAQVSVPLGCAAVVFLYYNWTGIVKNGPIGHGKHFLGPDMPLPVFPKWLIKVGLLLPIETISHSARLLSLTVRLWVNMLVSELLYAIFLGLLLEFSLFLGKINVAGNVAFALPLLIPVLFILLHIFVAILQAFVFTILPIIYVAGSVVEEH